MRIPKILNSASLGTCCYDEPCSLHTVPTADRSILEVWACETPSRERCTGSCYPTGAGFADTTSFYSDGWLPPQEPPEREPGIFSRTLTWLGIAIKHGIESLRRAMELLDWANMRYSIPPLRRRARFGLAGTSAKPGNASPRSAPRRR